MPRSRRPRASTGAPRVSAGYTVFPSVLCLVRHRDAVLLIEGAQPKAWAGKLNGIGGGIKPGEHPVRAAAREIHEETGLLLAARELQVKGVMHSHNFYGRDKVMLIVVADAPHRRVRGGREGRLRWVPIAALGEEPDLVPDLATLIPRVLALGPGELVAGVAAFDGKGGLRSLDVMTVRT